MKHPDHDIEFKPVLARFDWDQTHDVMIFSNKITHLGTPAFYPIVGEEIVLVDRYTPLPFEWCDNWSTKYYELNKEFNYSIFNKVYYDSNSSSSLESFNGDSYPLLLPDGKYLFTYLQHEYEHIIDNGEWLVLDVYSKHHSIVYSGGQHPPVDLARILNQPSIYYKPINIPLIAEKSVDLVWNVPTSGQVISGVIVFVDGKKMNTDLYDGDDLVTDALELNNDTYVDDDAKVVITETSVTVTIFKDGKRVSVFVKTEIPDFLPDGYDPSYFKDNRAIIDYQLAIGTLPEGFTVNTLKTTLPVGTRKTHIPINYPYPPTNSIRFNGVTINNITSEQIDLLFFNHCRGVVRLRNGDIEVHIVNDWKTNNQTLPIIWINLEINNSKFCIPCTFELQVGWETQSNTFTEEYHTDVSSRADIFSFVPNSLIIKQYDKKNNSWLDYIPTNINEKYYLYSDIDKYFDTIKNDIKQDIEKPELYTNYNYENIIPVGEYPKNIEIDYQSLTGDGDKTLTTAKHPLNDNCALIYANNDYWGSGVAAPQDIGVNLAGKGWCDSTIPNNDFTQSFNRSDLILGTAWPVMYLESNSHTVNRWMWSGTIPYETTTETIEDTYNYLPLDRDNDYTRTSSSRLNYFRALSGGLLSLSASNTLRKIVLSSIIIGSRQVSQQFLTTMNEEILIMHGMQEVKWNALTLELVGTLDDGYFITGQEYLELRGIVPVVKDQVNLFQSLKMTHWVLSGEKYADFFESANKEATLFYDIKFFEDYNSLRDHFQENYCLSEGDTINFIKNKVVNF